MENELADFLHYCRVERRLAELTCTCGCRELRSRPVARAWSVGAARITMRAAGNHSCRRVHL